MSPLIFAIVMEYLSRALIVNLPASFKFHKGCKKVKVNHLCFADYLFLFSHGDFEPMKSLRDAVKHFEHVFGLQVNDSKSSMYFARVLIQVKRQILQTLNFREGILPITYLGVPLVSTVI